jgi:hypothetical protein
MRLRRPFSVVITTVLLTALASRGDARGHRRHVTCDPTDCTLQAAIEESCPCRDSSRHGRYIRCVAHATKRLAAVGIIDRHCRGKVVSLAAHSVCGFPDAVVCIVPTSTCTDDGICANDEDIDCTVDEDCGTECTTTTPGACDSSNGTASDAGSCTVASCAASPNGAFLDSAE